MQASLLASQSFDGTALARLLLEPLADGDTSPPRIHRFSFEDDALCVPTSFSGQFQSCYGLAYDDMDSPSSTQIHRDMVLDRPPPHTPPLARDRPSPSQEIFSPLSTRLQSTDDPFSKASPTLFPSTRSLLPGNSLLSNTPSFLRFKARSQVDSSSPQQSPTTIQCFPQAQPISMFPSQAISRQHRPSLDSTTSTFSNRRVTVQQLALDFPLARSRSSSLSVLIHTLEDASPGWYQSLIDSTLPRAEPQSPMSPSPDVLRRTSPHRSPSPTPSRKCALQRGFLAPIIGLPPDMLVALEGLEALAITIARLPIPRPRTMALHTVEAAFFPQANDPSPPLVLPPTDPIRHRQEALEPFASPTTQLPMSDSASSSDSLPSINQPAAANIVHHPKLAKTLGLRHVSSRRLLSSAKRSVSDDAPMPRSPIRSSPNGSPRHASAKGFPTAKTPRRDSTTVPKTPKSLKSLFRRRPSAPPMPMQEYQLTGSPVGSSTSARRAAHLSEPSMIPVRVSVMGSISTTGKNAKHFSSTTQAAGPPSVQRRPPLGSFLMM